MLDLNFQSRTTFTNISKEDQHLLRLHGISKQLKVILPDCKSNIYSQSEARQSLLRSFGITHEVKIHLSKIVQAVNVQRIYSKVPKKPLNSSSKSTIVCPHSNSSYQCHFRKQMRSHLKAHSSKRSYKCILCEKTYKTSQILNQHLKTAHKYNRQTYACPYLNCTFQGFSILIRKNHLAKVHNEKPFKCNICSHSCSRNANLKKHMLQHLEVKQFKCCYENCNYETHFKESLKAHEARHLPNEQKPFRCDFDSCTKFFAIKAGLKEHMLNHHSSELINKKHKCLFCKYQANNKCRLETHMRVHTGEKPFKCKVCEYASARETGLQIHLRTHTGEKPYPCCTCKREFTHLSQLKLHVRIHTEEIPFACGQCDFKTNYKAYLKSHILNKHESKNQVRSIFCRFCPQELYHRSSLHDHLKTHNSEKPYKCNECNKRLFALSKLKIHGKAHIAEKSAQGHLSLLSD